VPKLFTLKDHFKETRLHLNRTVAATIIVSTIFTIILIRLIFLQIYEHDRYKTLSLNNQVRVVPIPPARGNIYDRKGELLAENVPAFNLEITPEHVTSMPETLDKLETMGLISETERENFNKQLKYKRQCESIPIRMKLNEEEVARFSLEKHHFPGVEITARLIRYYPLSEQFAHTLGYIGPISEKDLQENETNSYQGMYYIGKTGIERSYESTLKGTVGYQHIETDARGRTIRILKEYAPKKGMDLHLSVDSRLQKKAYEILGDSKGALVALDPKSGEVLAMVSKPSFDPNIFVQGINTATYRAFKDSPDKPLFNRAIQGQYPPGSTIKPLVALQALDLQFVTPAYGMFDPGYFQLNPGGRLYRDWIYHKKNHGHGWVNLESAIAQSCDIYFFTIAHKLGVKRLHDIFTRFGLGSITNIDIPGEAGGLAPSSEWKRKVRQEDWYPGDTLNIGIGQGMMQATPLQIAQITAALSMKGVSYTPHLVKEIIKANGPPVTITPTLAKAVILSHPEHWDTVLQAMHKVVHSPMGTAYRAATQIKYQMAGKTGTAQVYSLKQNEKYDANKVKAHLRDHSWFIAFAPVDDPQIAVALIVENKHMRSAVELTRSFLDCFFEEEIE